MGGGLLLQQGRRIFSGRGEKHGRGHGNKDIGGALLCMRGKVKGPKREEKVDVGEKAKYLGGPGNS